MVKMVRLRFHQTLANFGRHDRLLVFEKKIIFGNFNFVDDTVKVILESKYRFEKCWFYKFIAQI